MAKHNPKVETIGDSKATSFLVDPNPPGNGIIPMEDLFMYVRLRAIRRSRSVIETDGGTSVSQTNVDGEINFIATEILYGPDGKTPTNGGETYATTNWSNIGGEGNSSTGELEGFGIDSINITYGASLVPQVDMSFTDLRGSSLFDVIDSDDRKTPYSVFFTMPYPIFELTVKGYYGKAVTYCLHMINWNSEFDGSTGNFKITAKFVGFQQAFLADMVLGNIMAVGNTKEGEQALKEINESQLEENPDAASLPKLDVFINQITKLPSQVKDLKAKDDSFATLKKVNAKISVLKDILNFIGDPIPKLPGDKTENDPTTIISSKIGTGWFQENDYTVIRDLVVIKENLRYRFKQYCETGYKLIENYRNLVGAQAGKTTDKLGAIGSSIFINVKDEGISWLSEFGSPEKGSRQIFSDFYALASSSGTTNHDFIERWNNENFEYSRLNDFRTTFIGPSKFSAFGFERVFVIDFHPMRKDVRFLYDEEKTKRDALEKIVLDKVNDKLAEDFGFNPTLRNVVNIIMNNTQAMLKSIYNISHSAESKKTERLDILKNLNIISDGSSTSVYPWPEILQEQATGERTELTKKWLGGLLSEDQKSSFPEVQFVEDSLAGFISSTSRVKGTDKTINKVMQDNDRDGFYPFYPGDIQNRYLGLNNLGDWVATTKSIPNTLLDIIIDSPFKFNGVGGASNKTEVDFGNLESEQLCLTLINDVHKQVISKNLTLDLVLEYAINEGKIIPDTSGNNYISDTVGVFETGPKEQNYILLPNNGNYNNIVNNITQLPIEILFSSRYDKNIVSITDYRSKDVVNEGVKYFDGGYKLPTHDLTFLVYGKEIKNQIIPSEGELDFTYQYRIEDIEKVDEVNNAGESANTYIGVLNKEKKILESGFYFHNKDKRSRALILLNTIPYDNPNTIIPLLADRSKVVILPRHYVLWLGGTLWRKKVSENTLSKDPIKYTGTTNEIGQIALDTFLYWEGASKVYGENNLIPQELLGLNEQTKEGLISYFDDWTINGGFESFESKISAYTESIIDSSATISGDIAKELESKISLISVSPRIWTNNYGFSDIKKSTWNSYVSQFITNFVDVCETEEIDDKGNAVDSESSSFGSIIDNDDLKIVHYEYFKNIYDKWIGGTTNEKGLSYNICGPDLNSNLIDYFKFINRSWCDIGDEAVMNLDSVSTLAADPDSNVYFYIAKILRDSNFLLQILPSYINFKNADDVREIFMPIQTLDTKKRGPVYVCIQAGGNSKVLDLPKITNNDYREDTIVFDGAKPIPAEFLGCKKPKDNDSETFGLVAFRVAFGAQNQTIFKNVSLNQQEHRETGEYFKALTNLIDKRGGTQKVNQGTDLYPIFQARSYTAKVDGLGCMNIQPLMYFQLDNVPFFHGAYLITNVQHSITPNHITTNFTGVRQSNVTVPIVKNATTFLKIQLDEEFENTKVDLTPPKRNLLEFGVEVEITNPNDAFAFDDLQVRKLDANNQPQRGILNQLGIKSINEQSDDIDLLFTDVDFANKTSDQLSGGNTPFAKTLIRYGILTNAQVLMFLANIMVESDGFYRLREIWLTPMLKDGVAQNGSSTQMLYENNKNLNEETGDGYKYRGRGYNNIVGRHMFKAMDNGITKTNLDVSGFPSGSLVDYPDIISATQENALESACWFWKNINITKDDLSKDYKTSSGTSATSSLLSGGNGDDSTLLNEVAKDGKGTSFASIIRTINSKLYLKEKADTLEKILKAFGKLDPFNI